MILIDDRIGSVDLAEPLQKMGLPIEVCRLEFGDIAFEGKGNGQQILEIGIELKKLSDLVGSLRSGRLSGHQLPGLLGPKGTFDYAWLVVEGEWRIDTAGRVIIKKWNRRKRKFEWVPLPGNMLASEMMKQVLTLELCGGFHVRYTNTRRDTVQFLAALYRWWTSKPLDRHTSHLMVHTPASFLPVSDFRATVQRFPGIGPRASLAVERHFQGGLRRAVCASTSEWAEIQILDGKGKPRRIGMKVAKQIYDFVNGK